jgi:cbb3-type cytochrome oxidase subunit 3
MRNGDGWIIFLILLVLGTWLFVYTRNRMKSVVQQGHIPIPEDDEPVSEDEVTRLLSEEGYTIISGKQRIPIQISVNDDAEPLQSRLFIDYFAEKDGLYYTVKIARDRKPLEMRGSAVRDRLLIYQLVYPQTSGVLYVELGARKVNVIVFELDTEEDAG